MKATAAPIFYAIQVLRGLLPPEGLQAYRALGGLQAYPSRARNPDWLDFSTGSMELGAVAPDFAALMERLTGLGLWALVRGNPLRPGLRPRPRTGRGAPVCGGFIRPAGAPRGPAAVPAVHVRARRRVSCSRLARVGGPLEPGTQLEEAQDMALFGPQPRKEEPVPKPEPRVEPPAPRAPYSAPAPPPGPARRVEDTPMAMTTPKGS